MYKQNYQGDCPIQLSFNAKIDGFIAKVHQRDSGAQIHIAVENCMYPEESAPIEGMTMQMQDNTITIIGSDGVKSKYAAYINQDGTIGGAVYI